MKRFGAQRGTLGRALAGGLLAALVPALAAAAGSQAASSRRPAGIVGDDVQVRDAADLVSALRQSGPGTAWIAYETAIRSGAGRMCCYHEVAGAMCCPGCRLVDDGWYRDAGSDGVAGGALEQPPVLRVFVRASDGRIERIRTFSAGCPIDAHGTRVLWLGEVPGSQSLQLLVDRVEAGAPAGSGAGSGLLNSAVAAISFHAGHEPLERLLDWARHADSTDVRRQSIFWLSQRAGERAAATIENAVLNDPDEEVKRQAVFALGQLAPDRGIPLLVHIARTHPIPSVRRQAVFWLGQLEDPRALDFIQRLLGLD